MRRWWRSLNDDLRLVLTIFSVVALAAVGLCALVIVGHLAWWVCDAISDSRR